MTARVRPAGLDIARLPREQRRQEINRLAKLGIAAEDQVWAALNGAAGLRRRLREESRGHRRYRAAIIERTLASLKTSPLSGKEDTRTARRCLAEAHAAWSEADSHRWQIAASVFPIACSVANHIPPCGTLDSDDLEQEAMIGCLRAARRFDPKQGVTFATMAQHWIRAAITALQHNHGQTIRRPGGMHEARNRMHHILREAEIAGVQPSEHDLAAALEVSLKRLRQLRLINNRPVFLDTTPMNRPEDRNEHELLADDRVPDPDDLLDVASIRNRVQQAVARVASRYPDARHVDVFRRYFRLDGGDVVTLAELAAEYSLSRERIRQWRQFVLYEVRDELLADEASHQDPYGRAA